MVTYSLIQKSQLEGAHRMDAEYYQPLYLEIVNNLNRIKAIPIYDIATNPKRKFQPVEGEIFNYIEISEVDLSTGEYNKYKILGEDAPDRAQWIVKQNDIIISTVRPIRNAVSLINEDSNNLVASSGFAVLRTKEIEPEYLFVYLKTKPIVLLLDRLTTATMYPAVTTDDILNTKIYLSSDNFRKDIKAKVIESQKELAKSRILYSQAESLLLEELGLKDFKPKDELSYVVNLSEAKSFHRIDAEYFQTKYDKLISKIKSQNSKILGKIVTMKKGIEPGSEEYQDEGKLFIRVSSITKNGIIDKDQKYLSNELYDELKNNFEPKVGEILLTKDATPCIAYVIKEPIEGIISSGILRLELRDKTIQEEYLTLCLNSLVGKMQAERDGGGSIITHWKPEQIKNVIIPIISEAKQQQIADLVKQSHEARKKAKELLEQTKRMVEAEIEKGQK